MQNSVSNSKPTISFWSIWNMCFGFLGIQFGWALQMNNMSVIYEYLGAAPDAIPGLWLAAPMTGLIVQPIVGYLSDRTWHPILGRRRPYFLIGAILSSIMLFVMPQSSAVWMAAGSLWILDSSINISMEPFRAFVADKLNEKQRSTGYAMQSMFIGLGSFIAGYIPTLLVDVFNFSREKVNGKIPQNLEITFYIGGAVFFAAVLYTVLTSKEYPPNELEKKSSLSESKAGISAGVTEIISCIIHMPLQMKRIALVQFLTWPGLFLMWFYYSPAVANDIFHATGTDDPNYALGNELAGKTYSIENLVTFLFSFCLPFIVNKISARNTHALCLTIGGVALFSIRFIENPAMLYILMACVGVAWASILSMPYTMLGGIIPAEKMGLYMGIFNFFIVIPEILASLFFGYFMKNVLHNDRIAAVMIGGTLLLLAAACCFRIKNSEKILT